MKGFTLIELLVVVIIIGILAGIALPQYIKTVEKARATEAVVVSKAIQDAAQRHLQEFPGETPTKQAHIADMKLSGGRWLTSGSSGIGESSCFLTKHFSYDISSGITVLRVDDPVNCSSSSPKYTVVFPIVIPEGQVSRMTSFTSGSEKDYSYIEPLFEQ